MITGIWGNNKHIVPFILEERDRDILYPRKKKRTAWACPKPSYIHDYRENLPFPSPLVVQTRTSLRLQIPPTVKPPPNTSLPISTPNLHPFLGTPRSSNGDKNRPQMFQTRMRFPTIPPLQQSTHFVLSLLPTFVVVSSGDDSLLQSLDERCCVRQGGIASLLRKEPKRGKVMDWHSGCD